MKLLLLLMLSIPLLLGATDMETNQGEDIVAFEEEDTPVLNNEIRKLRKTATNLNSELAAVAYKVKGSSSDSSGGYLDAKVKYSIEVDSDQLQLTNDTASPTASQYYGTDSAGTRGWNDFPDGKVLWSYTTGIWGNEPFLASSSTLNPDEDMDLVWYHNTQYNWLPIIHTKFRKTAGINEIHMFTHSPAGQQGDIRFALTEGNGTSTTCRTGSNNWNNDSDPATLSVAGLTNGNYYSVEIDIYAVGSTIEVDSIIAFGIN